MTPRTAASPQAAGTKLRLFVVLPAPFVAGAALLWWMVLPGNPFESAPVVGTCLSWLVLIAAVGFLRQVPRRRVGAVVVAGTVLLGLVAVGAPPRTSNDSARYAWDGIVQKAGISPYSYVPIDETLSSLRPGWLFAPGASGPDGRPVCARGLFGTDSVAAFGYPSGNPLCTAINRPHVPTIYPPTAELYFVGVRAAVPDTVGYLPFQLGGLLISVAVTLMLLRVLARRGLPLELAAVWGWSPLVLLEAVNNAHVDVLGGALILAAGMLLAGGRPLRSGAAFGAAVATKLIPVIAAPALLFRRPVRFIAAAAGTFVLLYVPYLAVAGAGVLGFLPGYLKEEGYSQSGGIRFGLAQLVSAGPWPPVLSAAALAIVALGVLRRTRAENVWDQQTVMIGLTLLVVSPTYPWYALMLLPFIVLSRRWEYTAVILALDVIYMVPKVEPYSGPINQGALLAAAAALAAGAWLRRRAGLRLAAASALRTEAMSCSPEQP
ncbi:glycosyltransferase 87 family protein [Pseudarthrobacter albicanus]|uniref:glycosyltransferase 87 family protein n=1 Tax=Pseudarthrobacter albicanus TaxID=2823873 RepID=UPI001BACEB92|nr:glycosyltransferase 87 family protein [Pseudarthrobacter albicanus]